MVIQVFVPMFAVALLFFILILQLIDVFTYIWRYISLDVPFMQIALVQLYYLPKCIAFSISPSLLFAVSFTLGTFYTNNELISIFGAGISLYRLILPLLFIGFLLSIGGFYFEEELVIDTYRIKNTMSQDLLKQRKTLSNTNVTVIGDNSRMVYHAEYYNDSAKTLRGLIILERDATGKVVGRIDAEQAIWRGDRWELQNARIFVWDEKGEFLQERDEKVFSRQDIAKEPSTFRKTVRNIGEMKVEEARLWVESLRKAGLPYREPLTEFYKRYSFALTPIIVALISCAIGGRFKKNILLMSLLLSLVISVLYYVSQMISALMAKTGMFTPIMGAWVPFIIFFAISLWLFKIART